MLGCFPGWKKLKEYNARRKRRRRKEDKSLDLYLGRKGGCATVSTHV
jgi:hypothetical protein